MAQFYNKQLHFPLSGSFTGSLSGSFVGVASGSFSGSFFGNGAGLTNISASSVVGLNLFQIVTGSVSASVDNGPIVFTIQSGSSKLFTIDHTGSVNMSGSLTLNATGSIPYFFLIKSGSKSVFQINQQGVVENKVFEGGIIPNAVYGAMYFSSQSVFVALDQATFK